MSAPSPRVLVLVPQEVEELELVAPVDLLRRAGAQVVLAGIFEGIHCTGRNGITLHVDRPLAAEDCAGEFDLLLIPGGPGVKHLRADGRAAALAGEFHMQGKKVAAICAAPLILKDAGLLGGRRFTAHASTLAELPGPASERVVTDGLVTTSRGAGTAVDFGLELVRVLFGEAKAQEIAASIGN